MKRILAVLLVSACWADAEEKVTLHIYDVSALTTRVIDHRGPNLGFDALGIADGSEMGAIGVGTSGGEEEGTAIPGDDLKLFISQVVAPGTWDTQPHSIEYQNGSLIVVHTQAAHDKIKAFLDIIRSQLFATITVEADVYELAPGVLETSAGALLTDDQVKALDAAAADPAKGRRVASMRASGLNTERFHASALAQETYVRDFDIEIAQKAVIGEPDMGMLQTGYCLDVVPTLSQDRSLVLLTARFTAAQSAGMRTFESGGTQIGPIDEPDQAVSRTKTTLCIPAGAAALLSSTAYAAAGSGWSQVVVVRPTVAGDTPLPWPDSGTTYQLRVYDVRAVLYGPPDFPGPRLGGIPVGGGSGSGPSTSFAPPEMDAGALVSAEQLETMIKQNTGIASWTEHEGQVSIALTGNRQLLVIQSAAVLKEIEELLARLTRARSRNVNVDSWVIALDEASWNARRASLSGELTEAAWTTLLADASKGGGVRIAGTASAAGLNASRFHAARGIVRTMVLDHDVQIAEGASALDPVVTSVAEGVSLDVTPAAVGDSGQVQLDLRPTVVLGGEVSTFPIKDKGSQMQGTSLSDFGIRTQLLVDGGKPALVGVATREDGGKTEILLLVVKATVSDVK